MSTLRKLSIASLCITLLLIGVGGYVRATSSGLGCGDDWPDCNGRLAPALATRAERIEFSHRAIAGVVMILIGLAMVQALRKHRAERYIVRAAVLAFGLVLFQALLGALVVFVELEAASVVLHLGTALGVLAVLIFLLLAIAQRDAPERAALRDRSYMKQAAWAAGAVYLLLLVGSYVSGKEAGLVFPDWPLMDGQLIPDLGHELRSLHFFHRVLAAVVGVIVLITGLRLAKLKDQAPLAARFGHIAMGLFAVEIVVGALNVWTELNSAVVTAHLAIGALIWASLVAATVSLHPVLDRVGERATRERTRTPILEGSR